MSISSGQSNSADFADLLQRLQAIHLRDVAMVNQLQAEISEMRNCIHMGAIEKVDRTLHTLKLPTPINKTRSQQSVQEIVQEPCPDSPVIRASQNSVSSGLSSVLTRQPSEREQMWLLKDIAKIVKSDKFDICFCTAILANALSMAFEVQYSSWDVGREINYPNFRTPANEICSWCYKAFSIMAWIFGIMFMIELVLRIVVFRSRWFVDAWNYLDFAVVLFWLLSATNVYSNLGFNPQVIRLIRLARLLRLLRIVRKIQGFDALLLMTTAIKGSFFTLAWAFMLLFLCQLATALFINQFLHQIYFNSGGTPKEGKLEVFKYYGTFDRAFFTMTELTLANWPPAIRVLAENVSPWFFIFGIVYKFVLGFAVIGVVNAVFMQETFRVASMDDTLMVRQKVRASKAHRKKMAELMFEANSRSGVQGYISKNEWLRLCQDKEIKMWLSSMDLRMEDVENLFHLIDESGDGKISFDELEKGVARLRGAAKNLDVMMIIQELRQMNHRLNSSHLWLPEQSMHI